MAVLLLVLLGVALSQPLQIIEVWDDSQFLEFSSEFKGFLRFLAVCDKDCPDAIALLMDSKITMHDPPVIPGVVRDTSVLSRSQIPTDIDLLYYRPGSIYPEIVRGQVTASMLEGIMEEEFRPVRELKSKAEVEKVKNSSETCVIGYFKRDTDLKALFWEVAEGNSEVVPFYSVSDSSLATEFQLSDVGVVVVRNQLLLGDEKPYVLMERLESVEELEQEVLTSLFGDVGWITNTNYFLFREEHKGLLTLFVKADSHLNPSMVKYYASRLRQLASDYYQHLTFTLADIQEFAYEVENFRIESEAFVMIDDTHEIYVLKEVSDGTFKSQEVREFIESYIAKSLKPYRVSQAEPTNPYEGRVRVLVGSQFDDFIQSLDRDLLLLLVSPDCDECVELLQVLQEVAGIFEKSLTVAKIDAIENSLPRVYDPYDLPSLYLAKKDRSPVAYPSYDYNVASIVEFLESYAMS
jgi:hypothetical protein